METILMSTENSKTNEPHKFILNLSQRLAKINMSLFKTYLFTTWKNIKKQYRNNSLKIIAPTWMMNLNYQVIFILYQMFKVIPNI